MPFGRVPFGHFQNPPFLRKNTQKSDSVRECICCGDWIPAVLVINTEFLGCFLGFPGEGFWDQIIPKSHCQGRCWEVRLQGHVRVLIQSWRWDPPKLLRKIPSFSQKDLENFLSGGYPNRNSGIHPPLMSIHSWPWFSAGRQKFSVILLLRCLSRKWGSHSEPAPYKNPTVSKGLRDRETPLRLRVQSLSRTVQSLSRTRLRIAASIAFVFRAGFKEI